jgi:acyl-CoA synthetase (AMP-forming)/AMP-acid ligase II
VAKSDFMDVIIDTETPMRHAKPGEVGIFSRAGHIPAGYYNDPVKTDKTFVMVDGKRWLLTGDAAKLEDDNSILFLVAAATASTPAARKSSPKKSSRH